MMKRNIERCELRFVDTQPNKLTLDAQESIKERLLSQAKERAFHDASQTDFPHKVHEYYYDELACFMQAYPHVLIDLVLIKLEENSLN